MVNDVEVIDRSAYLLNSSNFEDPNRKNSYWKTDAGKEFHSLAAHTMNIEVNGLLVMY